MSSSSTNPHDVKQNSIPRAAIPSSSTAAIERANHTSSHTDTPEHRRLQKSIQSNVQAHNTANQYKAGQDAMQSKVVDLSFPRDWCFCGRKVHKALTPHHSYCCLRCNNSDEARDEDVELRRSQDFKIPYGEDQFHDKWCNDMQRQMHCKSKSKSTEKGKTNNCRYKGKGKHHDGDKGKGKHHYGGKR